jgi:hypothetical protein
VVIVVNHKKIANILATALSKEQKIHTKPQNTKKNPLT